MTEADPKQIDDETPRGGGEGEVAHILDQPGGRKRQSLLLIERAIRQGWNIPNVMKQHLPGVVSAIAADAGKSSRVRLTAGKLLVAMEDNNINAALALSKLDDDPERAVEADRGIAIQVNVTNEIKADPKCREAMLVLAEKQAELVALHGKASGLVG